MANILDEAGKATQELGQAVQQATPPLPAESAFSWGGYFTAIGTLFILLAVLWALVWALRKYGKFNFIPRPGSFPRDGLRLEAQLPMGPRKGLAVVRFLDKRLLLGVTDNQISLLQEIEVKDDTGSTDFQSLLENEEAHDSADADLASHKSCKSQESHES